MRCVSILNAGITFLDGSGVRTKYFCQPQERSDVIFGPFTFQDLELLDFSYAHREDQGNLGAIEALGYMFIPLLLLQSAGVCGFRSFWVSRPSNRGLETREMVQSSIGPADP